MLLEFLYYYSYNYAGDIFKIPKSVLQEVQHIYADFCAKIKFIYSFYFQVQNDDICLSLLFYRRYIIPVKSCHMCDKI